MQAMEVVKGWEVRCLDCPRKYQTLKKGTAMMNAKLHAAVNHEQHGCEVEVVQTVYFGANVEHDQKGGE